MAKHLAKVAGIIRGSQEIQVLDDKTNEDLTLATMVLIIFEEEKQRPKLQSSGFVASFATDCQSRVPTADV